MNSSEFSTPEKGEKVNNKYKGKMQVTYAHKSGAIYDHTIEAQDFTPMETLKTMNKIRIQEEIELGFTGKNDYQCKIQHIDIQRGEKW